MSVVTPSSTIWNNLDESIKQCGSLRELSLIMPWGGLEEN